MMSYLKGLIWCAVLCVLPAGVWAGSLDAPAAPGSSSSAMYTLDGIYNRLNSGAAGAKRSGAFTKPSAVPGSSGHTLDEVMGKTPTADNNGAMAAEVWSGKAFWGLRTNGWGPLTGTMTNVGTQNITPGTSAQTITQGYHDGTGSVEGDADLVAGNIRCGVTIFGVTGTNVPVCVAKTGQTTVYSAGDDGAYQKGCDPEVAAFSGYDNFGNYNRTSLLYSGGFTNNGDGTVTDNLTGLIWLKNANCFGKRSWTNALSDCNNLESGSCGLDDGSSAGEWRLPNINELRSLFDPTLSAPYLPAGHPFTNVQSYYHWSSTTNEYDITLAWVVSLHYGEIGSIGKTGTIYVWPVRGGQ